MRTLFASAVFLLLGSSPLAAQVVPPASRRPGTVQAPAQSQAPAPAPGIYLITFRAGTPASEKAAVAQAHGARLRRAYEGTSIAAVEVPDSAVLARLRNDPRILGVFANQTILLEQGRGGSTGNGKPKAPESAIATAASQSQINLSWADVSNNEDGFAIERCAGSACTNFSEIVRVGSNVSTYANSGLAAQTFYRYRLLSFNASGNSKYSNIAEATTLAPPPPPPPAAPSNLNAIASSFSQVSLTWFDNANNEAGFQIERCDGPIANCAVFTPLAPVGVNVTTSNDVGLQALATYTYRVRAYNANGQSAYSNSAQVTMPAAPPPPPPAAPSNLNAVASSYSQVNFSWTDNSNDEAGFQIERCDGPSASCTVFASLAPVVANVTTSNDVGLQALATYTYRVRAYNANGQSAYSNSAQVTMPAAPPPPPPAAPSNLNAVASSASQVNLSWADNSSDESGFQIERCDGPIASCAVFTPLAPVVANVTTSNDVGLQALATYTYRVRAFNANGQSPYSNSVQVTMPAAPPPPPPAVPSNLNAVASSYSQVNLSWTDNSNDEAGFQIERCDGPIASCAVFTPLAPVGADVTSSNDGGLQALATYTYRVRAYNANGQSAYSNSAQVTMPAAPPPPPPAAPSNLTAVATSYSQVNLSWMDNSNDESGFQIERCDAPMASCTVFTPLTPVGANVTASNDVGLQALATYTYRVRSHNANGQSAYSNSAQVTMPAAPPPPPPAAPSNLNAVASSYSQVNLSWADNSNDESGFQIERCIGSLTSCTTFVQIGQVVADISSFNNSGLQNQTTYSYRVRAFNGNGQSQYSNSVQVTTPSAPSTQVVPSGVQRIGAAPGMFSWTGQNVGVAVVDTGLDFSHADLELQAEIPGVNSFNAFAVGTTCQDIHGHGTHVAGIIGAKNNLIDVVGVAPNATLYCVNVFEPDPNTEVAATDESLIAGLDWVLTHANTVTPRIRVVNMSLGRDKTIDDDNPNHPLHVIVKALRDAGISVVVAAGNDPEREVSEEVPAFYPEVMAVASTTAEEGVNGYDSDFPACTGLQAIKADSASSFTTDGAFLGGTGVTISAPGEQREDMFNFFDSCFLEPIGILSTAAGGGTVELSGTSMASPHVAGVVALMWEKELSLGLTLAPEAARTRIRSNAIRRGTAPLDSPLAEYTFDGEREGVIWAPSALLETPPPPIDAPPTVTIVSPANNSSFSSGTSIHFAATATDPEDGNIAASLHWILDQDDQIATGASFNRILSSGSHLLTASLVDSGGNTGSASITVTVGSPATPTTVHVSSVTYSFQGTTLFYTVKLVNEFGGPVSGASIRVSLYEWVYTGWLWFSNGVTDSQGNARFQLNNADYGCYTTLAENVVAPGLTWISGTPDNNYCRL